MSENLDQLHQESIEPSNTEVHEARKVISRALGGLLLVGSVSAFIFEQSPLNEAARTDRALEVIKEGGDEFDAALDVFGVTMAIELGSSALIVAGLNQKGGVMNARVAKSRMNKERRTQARAERKRFKKLEKNRDYDKEPFDGLVTNTEIHPAATEVESEIKNGNIAKSALEYTGVSLGLGAGIVVIDEKMKTDNPSLKKDIKHSVAASTLISAVSGTIAYLGTGGIRRLEDTPLEWPAEKFVEYATDLKFWAIILSPIMLTRFGRWVSDIRREHKEQMELKPGLNPENGVALNAEQ